MNRPIPRRAFLAATASAGLLGGCVNLPGGRTLAAAPASCLPRVDVGEHRVIRKVAGLRPSRDAGFVVRAGPFGDKLLVHNYGHGGGGITLSWGTSKLAADLARSAGVWGTGGPLAVMGSGVVGLTMARILQERGREVTIYAAQLPPETTSNIAGGQIVPAGVFRGSAVGAAWLSQFDAACAEAWRRWQLHVGADTGVYWLPTYEEGTGPVNPPAIAQFYAGREDLDADRSPFGRPVKRYHTMYVEVGRMLRKLTADVLGAGGRIVVREFRSPADVAALDERIVFNCTGLGSHALFGDEGLVPRRGQLAVLLPQPEVDYAYVLGGSYMFPRSDGIVLGGTYERGQWDEVTTPEAIAGILSKHSSIMRTLCVT